MFKQSSIIKKLNYSYIFQGILITIAAICSIFFAKIAIEEILIKSAINEEANYYLSQKANNDHFNLPDTKNLTGYIDRLLLPEFIQKDLPLADGYYEYENFGNPIVLYIRTTDSLPLYLIYYRGQVDTLVVYYGLAPLAALLTLLYIILWVTYRWNHKNVSPVLKLASLVNSLDFNEADAQLKLSQSKIPINDEVETLLNALNNLFERLNDFVERERNFTRDASHELRSPLTVISIAAELLMNELEDDEYHVKTIHKIERAVDDMMQLIEVFLMISRENHNALLKADINIVNVIKEEIERSEPLLKGKSLKVELIETTHFKVWGSDMVLSVLIGNILRNAILYSQQGTIFIEILDNEVIIKDQGIGIKDVDQMFQPHVRGNNDNSIGFGVGLNIVKRLSDQFDWPISVKSQLNKGTIVSIKF